MIQRRLAAEGVEGRQFANVGVSLIRIGQVGRAVETRIQDGVAASAPDAPVARAQESAAPVAGHADRIVGVKLVTEAGIGVKK